MWAQANPVAQQPDLWSWESLGIIATAIAVVGGIRGTLHWLRALWQRHRTLRDVLVSVEDQNTALVTAAVRLSRGLINGVTWSGWRIPPPELQPVFADLAATERDLEMLNARVRGLRTEPAVERLREDIEHATTLIRRGVVLYREGTWSTYRELNDITPNAAGKVEYLISASGDDPAPALHNEVAVEEVRQLKRDLDLHVRSAWHQIGHDDRAKAFSALWPRWSYQLFGEPLNEVELPAIADDSPGC